MGLYACINTIQRLVHNLYDKSYFSAESVTQIFVGLLIAYLFTSSIRNSDRQETVSDELLNGPRYVPAWSAAGLPFLFICAIWLIFQINGTSNFPLIFVSMFFGVFLHLCVYYCFLILSLSFFRNRFSARACASLWLVPNFLYLGFSTIEIRKPNWIIPLTAFDLQLIAILWILGFAGVLLWNIVSHLKFRHEILEHAEDVKDPRILAVWSAEQDFASLKEKNLPLLYSPNVVTPLSIGLWKRTIRVILPKHMVDANPYSDKELSMILRHELIHIGREDSWMKFFMVFCTAICWFNPLIWIAMRRSADDLELSCDETVLKESSEAERKQYAYLLLRTAGDERGFTSCLSTSAEALKYRLKHVMVPKSRKSGASMVGLVLFFMFLTYGRVALAYNGATGHQYLFDSAPLSEFEVVQVYEEDQDISKHYVIPDSDAVLHYLAELPLYRLTGAYTFSEPERNRSFVIERNGEKYTITLEDQCVNIAFPRGRKPRTAQYYSMEPFDWSMIDSLASLESKYQPESNSSLPLMYLYHETENHLPQEMTVVNGIMVSEPEHETDKEPIMFLAEDGEVLKLRFSHPLSTGQMTVTIENWDRSSSRSLITESDLVLLGRGKTHYTVHAELLVNGVVRQMEYRFDVDKEQY